MGNRISGLILLGITSLLLSPLFANGNAGEKMLNALKTSNATLMTECYAAEVEISILGQSSLSTALDAEQILASFFREYPVTSCKVLHHGQRTQAEFYILRLQVAPEQNFRVYALLRTENDQQLIQQFRIDEAYE